MNKVYLAKCLYTAYCQGKGSVPTLHWNNLLETSKDYWLKMATWAIEGSL